MAERPGLYRGIRLGDAAALVAAAAALVLAAGAEADVKRVKPGADPSVDGGDFASQRGESRAAEYRPGSGGVVQLPGTDPAIGGGYSAMLDRGDVVLLARHPLDERGAGRRLRRGRRRGFRILARDPHAGRPAATRSRCGGSDPPARSGRRG